MTKRGVAEHGTAPVLGTGDQRFKSSRPDQSSCHVAPSRVDVPLPKQARDHKRLYRRPQSSRLSGSIRPYRYLVFLRIVRLVENTIALCSRALYTAPRSKETMLASLIRCT